jgi:hypothetical protein
MVLPWGQNREGSLIISFPNTNVRLSDSSVEAHPALREADAGASRVQGQLGLHSEALSQKTKTKQNKTKQNKKKRKERRRNSQNSKGVPLGDHGLESVSGSGPVVFNHFLPD